VSDGTRSWVVCRPLVRKAAWLMDTQGNKVAHSEMQAIKIATPLTVEWILDKAI
jgi:acyl-CoA dehydrogenase